MDGCWNCMHNIQKSEESSSICDECTKELHSYRKWKHNPNANEKRSDEEIQELIYNKAMKRIEQLAEEVVDTCIDLALKDNYEKDWVISRFRYYFNKQTNSIKD